jgi:sushi domain
MRNSNNNQNLVKARRIGAAVLAVTLAATVALTVVRPAIASRSQNTATSSIDAAAFAAEVSAAKGKLTIPFEQSVMDEAFPDVDWTVSHNSLADTLVERNEQAGFDTALSFPYTGVSQDDGQHYSSEQISTMRSEDEKERLNSLVLLYADFVSYKDVKLPDGTNLQDLNPWAATGQKMFEDAFLYGKGLADLMEETDPGHYVVAEKVRPYARANALLRRAFGEAEVRRVYSEKHWGLNHAGIAAEAAQNHPEVNENPDLLVLYTKATTFEGPENRDALVLRFVSKNGTTIAEIADNVHDKRPMIPGKQPKPEKETTPTKTPSTNPTPQETTPQETTAPETKTPGVDRETTPRNTPKKRKPDPKRTTEETTPQETPQGTKPRETKPSETPSREDREDNNKKRNVAPLNHDGEKAGGSSKRTGTDPVEYSDHKNETGKGHGDPAKETMVAPTTEASYHEVKVEKSDDNRMNQETKTAEPAANHLTRDDTHEKVQINGDANQAAKDGASVISNFDGEFEDHD